MQTRSKVVELGGKKFDLRMLAPEVGSFIFMRMMGVSMRLRNEEAFKSKPPEPAAADTEAQEKATGEMQVRAIAFVVFSGGISFDDFKFIQSSCMKVVSCENAAGFPMPVMTDSGTWTADGESLAANIGLVMQLTTEVLVHCFADFFESGGLGSQA